MADETKDEDLKLSEQSDGSVVVGATGDENPAVEAENKDEGSSDERIASNEGGEATGEEQGHADETEEEAEARRQRNRVRRAENKARRQDYVESLKRELAARDELLQQQATRLDALERRTQGADMAAVDAELRKTADAYMYFREQHAVAVTKADGAAAVEAQEKMYQAQRRGEELDRIKKAAQQRPQQAQPLDPVLKMNAEAWLGRNAWYDPTATDADSKIALTVDQTLAAEGWNPKTQQYWEELDARLKKYLPHRYVSGHNRGKPVNKSPVAGSGREEAGSSGSGGYRLSADRVQAIKDAGAWDDPKARAEMVRRYQEYDKQHTA